MTELLDQRALRIWEDYMRERKDFDALEFARRLLAEQAKADQRLAYLYTCQMNVLVRPIVTYTEWLATIDAAMREEGKS